MHVITIDNEVPRHVARNRIRVYEEFTLRTNDYIAAKCDTGVLKRKYENPIARAEVFFKLIDEQYTGLMRNTIEDIKRLFARHGIEFRLYDIHHVLHGYHRMTMLWAIDRLEYSFDFLWDSSQDNPFDSFYRLGLVNRCGDVSEGDILGLPRETVKLFVDGADLPQWFVSGLKQNS